MPGPALGGNECLAELKYAIDDKSLMLRISASRSPKRAQRSCFVEFPLIFSLKWQKPTQNVVRSLND